MQTYPTISKTFDFDAAHRLDQLPPEHKCHHLHGHTYRVEIRLQGPLDAMGMVFDYDVIAEVWAPIHALLDHKYLNEVSGLGHPTTENLARYIWKWLTVRVPPAPLREVLAAVRVYESATTWAEVTR